MRRHTHVWSNYRVVVLSFALILATGLTLAPSVSAATPSIKSPQPELLSAVSHSEVVYVLWTANCANDRSCYALERSDDGGQTFARVSAPPITFPRNNQGGPLEALDFANANDGLAMVEGASASSLWVTFNGGVTSSDRTRWSTPSRRRRRRFTLSLRVALRVRAGRAETGASRVHR